MKQRYFAFYWTYPIPSVGFTCLPHDVEEAARTSVTIRYSRSVVRSYVRQNDGILVPGGEVARIERESDRGSKALADDFAKLLDRASQEEAFVAIVVFACHKKWRDHQFLEDLYSHESCEPIELERDDLPSSVDPYEHFELRRSEAKARTALRRAASKPIHRETIRAALIPLPGEASFGEQAEALNAAGLRTFFDKDWTASNLRKFLELDRPMDAT